ncbi:MAG: DUF1573 domain-containing protein, partial [Bacteroidota bacterium]
MKKISGLLFLFIFAISYLACTDDKAQTDKRVEEIRTDDLGLNASIIRNPISADTPTDTVNVAKMEFDETTFVFGEVDAGAVIEHTFHFKNTGNIPLIVNGARS